MSGAKLYFDSNIWIHYLWVEKVSFSKEFANVNLPREICHQIVTAMGKKRYTVISSLFNDTEISNYFSDYLRFIKGLGLGFDYTNSHKYKDSFLLTRKEKTEINSYLTHINELEFVEVVELNLDEKSLQFFRMATCDYYLDYMDAFHLLGAMINGCRYLVSADKDFRKKANRLLKDQGLIKDIGVLYFKEAIKVLKI